MSIVTDNANGEESPGLFYRKLARLQPFHYQCSKSSTSNEVAAVFQRAIQRQAKVDSTRQQCLVFMDEAGLPEEEKESLKVLHYLLEGHMSASPDVAFVCITNHILDAAKSNRCACLLRPEPDKDELLCIATGILNQKNHRDKSNHDLISFEEKIMPQQDFADHLCRSYRNLIHDKSRFIRFVNFFGLRDFIHLIKCIRRNAFLRESILHVSIPVLLEALERNFNGIDREMFSNICAVFLASFVPDCGRVETDLSQYLRHPMGVVQSALTEKPEDGSATRYNLPRYKMIIDNTDDDSAIRLLQLSGILNESHSFYRLSGMKEGLEIEKLNLVSRVKFAAQQGDKTVFLSQVEEVSECFYDLFNQHFREFTKDGGEVSYFANIAIGGISRPCLIHPSFQCVVHVRASQLEEIPSPFLNRFEKFSLSVDDILTWLVMKLPRGLNSIVTESLKNVDDLLTCLGNKSMWSTSPVQTVKSIYVSILSPHSGSSSQLIEGDGQTFGGDSIGNSVLSFMNSYFYLDISIGDIHQSIYMALSELSGMDGNELREVFELGSDLGQTRVDKAFHDVCTGELGSPLSRSLSLIVKVSLTWYAVSRLLQMALPEALFLQR